MIEQPIQVGELTLRPVAIDDTEALFQVVDANRTYLRRWLPWVDSTQTVDDSRSFAEASTRQQVARQALHFVLLLAGKPIGMIGFHRFDWANRSTSFGYWLAEGYQGRGFMTSACRALIAIAFSKWELNRIEVRCALGNARSRAIPERLGFTYEGTLRSGEWLYDHFEDLAVYSLLASEIGKIVNRG